MGDERGGREGKRRNRKSKGYGREKREGHEGWIRRRKREEG